MLLGGIVPFSMNVRIFRKLHYLQAFLAKCLPLFNDIRDEIDFHTFLSKISLNSLIFMKSLGTFHHFSEKFSNSRPVLSALPFRDPG